MTPTPPRTRKRSAPPIINRSTPCSPPARAATFFFNGLDGDGFDSVIDPVILEPAVQFTLLPEAPLRDRARKASDTRRPFVRTTRRSDARTGRPDRQATWRANSSSSGDPRLPLLVRAEDQTRGRGRGPNAWWSDRRQPDVHAGDRPAAHQLTPAHEPRLALAAAVAVIEAVGPRRRRSASAGRTTSKRAAGSSAASSPSGSRRARRASPPDRRRPQRPDPPGRRPGRRPRHGRLSGRLGRRPRLDDVLAAFLARFAAVVPRLAATTPRSPRAGPTSTRCAGPVRVDLGPRVVSGVGRGIDAEGALILATADETLRLFGGRVLRG